MARSPPSAMPPSGVGGPGCPSSARSVDNKAVVEPARPDNYWIIEGGASGPLPAEAGSPALPQTDSAPSTEQPPASVQAAGPTPLAIPESSEISQGESPQRPSDPKDVSTGNVCSPARSHTGHPMIAEILQQ